MAKRSVSRIGGSLMVSIPADVARRLNIREGDAVDVDETEDGVIIRPHRSLGELIASWEPLGEPGVMADAAEILREAREERLR